MSQFKRQLSFRIPERMQRVQSPVIPVVGEMIKAHPGTISLGQGVVWYGPPPPAFAALQRFAADPENHKYKLVQGISPLLEVIARKLAAENAIRLDATNTLLVTAGGNMAFMNAVLAITDPGDEVILPTPYYFNHEMAITMAGCRPVLVRSRMAWRGVAWRGVASSSSVHRRVTMLLVCVCSSASYDEWSRTGWGGWWCASTGTLRLTLHSPRLDLRLDLRLDSMHADACQYGS